MNIMTLSGLKYRYKLFCFQAIIYRGVIPITPVRFRVSIAEYYARNLDEFINVIEDYKAHSVSTNSSNSNFVPFLSTVEIWILKKMFFKIKYDNSNQKVLVQKYYNYLLDNLMDLNNHFKKHVQDSYVFNRQVLIEKIK